MSSESVARIRGRLRAIALARRGPSVTSVAAIAARRLAITQHLAHLPPTVALDVAVDELDALAWRETQRLAEEAAP